jgi:hypothetical protein
MNGVVNIVVGSRYALFFIVIMISLVLIGMVADRNLWLDHLYQTVSSRFARLRYRRRCRRTTPGLERYRPTIFDSRLHNETTIELYDRRDQYLQDAHKRQSPTTSSTLAPAAVRRHYKGRLWILIERK